MTRIKFEINEDFDIFVTSKNQDGTLQKKLIDIESLYNAIDSCRGKESKVIESKKLNRNILYSSPLMPSFNGVHILQHIIKEIGREIVILQREARPSSVAFYNEVMHDVGMPSLIFAVYIADGVIQTAKVMAVKDKIIKPNSKLFCYPLSNVGTHGNVCFGANNLREFSVDESSFNNIHSFPNMFLMMPCSHEIRHQNKYGMELRPLLNHLKGKEFDNDMLVDAHITYKEWISRYVEV